MALKPMELYIANVPFDEMQTSKKCPALIVQVKEESVGLFKITSKYDQKLKTYSIQSKIGTRLV